ncbi:CYTH and CHAD domain-containing protein [Pseudoalteromonas sp. NEC-BIFX-2020_002]|uniref:Adenylate cyclase n=2 Tax=Pseudoalteromonas TaxID=53246 RepID=A0A0N1EH27_9GAMM|nr:MULTISPECIES: CYTH and CHAD domain-containing protein [Pseudoalteromonas]KPH61417.1 adenylate cyclase [Pseudoalteromonas porphyrae]NMR24440.1 CYTH and CHAD domain-containing protein [Pseudoalteromonas sp. NEC-BIFX-2020_015]NNG42096.1 CYTH and CHAD domain-containing protein [Pseudoalteromonas sp. NEC-BIFX-2020_002]
MDTEIELKFLVSDAVIPLIPALITQFAKTVTNKPSRSLQNAYFDTPSRELRALDIGFRTRCADNQCEQTIKLAGEVMGGLHQRPEYNLPLDGSRPDLSAFDANIWPHGMQVNVIAQNLYPIFSTNFIRRTWLIETNSGAKIEVVLDKGEVAASAKVEPICELEIELVEGSRNELFTLADILVGQSNIRLGLYSKAARGYRLADEKPLKPSKSIGFVSLPNNATQEQALIEAISFGIRFVQKHEQCYFDKPSLKTLKRVTDGISLIRHTFWLFDDIVDKNTTERLRTELKWLLSELAWVENAIQLKTYTSKRHAYYKKINSAPELTQVINDLKELQPSIEDINRLFHSARYNRLLLSLTTWLVDKQWRKSWGQTQFQAAEQPVADIAPRLFDKDWKDLHQLLPEQKTLTFKDYLNLRTRLENSLLSGNCLGSLFEKDDRNEFRIPWLDISHGMYELSTLEYLKQLCAGQDDDELAKIQNWLEKKSEYLVSAMEQSRLASYKISPYWL